MRAPPASASVRERSPEEAGVKPRRRRDPVASSAAILAAAREVFAERGYTRATIREIAKRAGVTHGLVMRHFGSKAQLLTAALPGPRDLPSIIAGDVATLPERLATAFTERVDAPESDHALIALIRSAAAGEDLAVPLYQELQKQIADAFRQVLEGPDTDICVSLLTALLVGVTFSRHVVPTGVVAEMTTEELTSFLTPAIGALLAPAVAHTG
jgi:AcrR family transcriptional regulator